jgi:hypothetical protein
MLNNQSASLSPEAQTQAFAEANGLRFGGAIQPSFFDTHPGVKIAMWICGGLVAVCVLAGVCYYMYRAGFKAGVISQTTVRGWAPVAQQGQPMNQVSGPPIGQALPPAQAPVQAQAAPANPFTPPQGQQH